MNFKRNKMLSIREQCIDEQHEELFNLVEQIGNILDKHITRKELKKILFKLFKCMKDHFKYEEEYMKSIEYPLVDEHILIHKNILKSMINFLIEAKTTNDLKEKLHKCSRNWLINHIIKEDAKIYHFIKSKQNISKDFIAKESLIQKAYLYICACKNKTHKIKTDIHKKIQLQIISITCKICKKDIEFHSEIF